MQINFNQLWKKDLGLIYKEVSIDKGKQFKVDIDLKEVKNIHVNYKVNNKSFTDSVEIIDIENNIINIPFKSSVLEAGKHELEIIAIMKNGNVLPSSTFTYTVNESLENEEPIEAETNYHILIELLDLAGNKLIDMDKSIQKVDTSIENMTNEISNYKEVTTNELEESFNNYSNNTTSSITRVLNNKTVEVDKTLNSEINKVNTTLTNKVNEVNRVLDNKVNEVDEVLDTTVTTINTELDKKSREVDSKINAKITDVNTSLNNKINEVDEIIEEVEASEQARKEEHLELVNELSSYSSDINNVKDRVEVLEAKITDNEVIVDLKNKVNNHETRIKANENTLKHHDILLKSLNVLDETISIENEEGTVISLPQSKDGIITIDELEGNTLVNYCTNGSEELTLNNEINTQGYNAIIKPSTQYTVAFDTDKSGEVNIGLGGAITSTTNNVATITTPNTLTDDTLTLCGKGVKASNVRLLEGDKANYIPQYFEGMKSCFEDKEQDNGSYEVEITSNNKNLFDVSKIEVGGIDTGTGLDSDSHPLRRRSNYIKVDGGESYTISQGTYNGTNDNLYITQYDVCKKPLKINNRYYITMTLCSTIELDTKTHYIRFRTENNKDVKSSNIQIEKGNIATDYVPYKSNSIQLQLNEPLRAVGDVKDRFVLKDSKLMIERNCGIREYQEGDLELDNALTDKINTVYVLNEPTYEEVPYETQKLTLECYENGTLFIDTLIPPTVSVTYSANKPVVVKLNQVDNTTNINTEDIAITQIAVDFLLMSSIGEEMINFKIKGGTNMSAYFASRIIKGALKYEDVISKYPNYKEDIDLILMAEGYGDLIVEL